MNALNKTFLSFDDDPSHAHLIEPACHLKEHSPRGDPSQNKISIGRFFQETNAPKKN
jgi:hypothetical protein